MKISDNHVVYYHFTVKDETGETIESSQGNKPLVYLHGHNNIIPGLEKAMSGRSEGDSFSVVIPPEEAYGSLQENAVQRIAIKHLHGGKKWKAGMTGFVETKQGYRQVKLLKVGKFMANVDLNHPLAGKTLSYDIEISKIREAGKEEIAHGHAHES